MGMVFRPYYKDKKTGERKQTRVWHIKYYADGKPISHTSGTKKKTDAERMLKQKEGRVANGENGVFSIDINSTGLVIVRVLNVDGQDLGRFGGTGTFVIFRVELE